MNRLVRISSMALMVAVCVGVSLCSNCLSQTLTGTENPIPLWPDNVATMSGADFTALLTKLQPLVPKELAGKPYSIQPGEEPGTYLVKWGSDSMVWKPQPWMEANYAKLGPYYYLQWTRKGMPYRWDVPIEDRAKMPAREFPARTIAYVYYMSGAKNGWDQWDQKIYLPDGSLRSETKFLEFYASPLFGKGMEYFTPSEIADVTRLYMWEAVEPEELRGQGGITTEYKAFGGRGSAAVFSGRLISL
jgi:hypothetical protein